jgi:hypothetical protein
MVIFIILEVVFRYFLRMSCAWARGAFPSVPRVVRGSGLGGGSAPDGASPDQKILIKHFPPVIQKLLDAVIYLAIAAVRRRAHRIRPAVLSMPPGWTS